MRFPREAEITRIYNERSRSVSQRRIVPAQHEMVQVRELEDGKWSILCSCGWSTKVQGDLRAIVEYEHHFQQMQEEYCNACGDHVSKCLARKFAEEAL